MQQVLPSGRASTGEACTVSVTSFTGAPVSSVTVSTSPVRTLPQGL